MEEPNKVTPNIEYDTTINIIGGLKDCSVIYKAIEAHFSEDDSFDELISERNEFVLRTERSRNRIASAINSTFLSFFNDDHKDLIENIFSSPSPLEPKQLILFWQFALTNRLFLEISGNVFVPTYFSGRTTLPKEDIVAYLKDFLKKEPGEALNWSESTINTIATKFLNFMTKLNLLSGARIKKFEHIQLSSELLALFLYFAKLYAPTCVNLLDNAFLPLSFIGPGSIVERIKKISQKGLVAMSYDGVSLKVELTHSYKGICDALYH